MTTDIILCLIFTIAIMAFSFATKQVDLGGMFTLMFVGVMTRLSLGANAFYLVSALCAFVLILRFILKLTQKSAYELFYPKPTNTLHLYSLLGFAIIELLLLVLSLNFYEHAIYNLYYLEVAFFVSIASVTAIEIARTVAPYAKNGTDIITNKKVPTTMLGSVTYYGASLSCISCFSVGIYYFMTTKSVAYSVTIIILSVLAYVLHLGFSALMIERKITVNLDECNLDKDSLAILKRTGVKGISMTSVNALTLFIVNALAIIVALIVK